MLSLCGTVLEVDIAWFLHNAIPSVAPEGVQEAIELLHPCTSLGRWKWYPTDPSQMGDDVYKDMKSISDAVLGVGEGILQRKATSITYFRPRNVEKSESQNADYESDAIQVLVDSTDVGKGHLRSRDRRELRIQAGELGCEDQGGTFFFVTYTLEIAQNRRRQNTEQLLGNAAHMIFSNPARRFRWGATAENASMRLWFLSSCLPRDQTFQPYRGAVLPY